MKKLRGPKLVHDTLWEADDAVRVGAESVPYASGVHATRELFDIFNEIKTLIRQQHDAIKRGI